MPQGNNLGGPRGAAFTPGPWAVSTNSPVLVTTAEDGNGMVRNIALAHFSTTGNTPENRANARLIAAAPELYEVLAEADRRIAWESCGLGNSFAERVEAALAKARGEQ